MAKPKTVYVCQNCGSSFPTWSGQCAACQEWNTLVEEVISAKTKSKQVAVSSKHINQHLISLGQAQAQPQNWDRISTHISEFDRVLGSDQGQERAGMVPGSVMLLGGEPGIGKSTVLTQLAIEQIVSAQATQSHPVVYVCGEESPSQISMRVARLLAERANLTGKSDTKASAKPAKDWQDALQFVTSTQLETILAAVRSLQPALVIVDSIQTVVTDQLTGAAGSIGQVRECADQLTSLAKSLNVPLFLVGHVTKEGTISGPKVLEHMVDAVLELSGERTGELRLLRALKNRFGATDEVGVFRVVSAGYEPVENPSSFLLEEAQQHTPGSAVACVIEGTRPLLLEVQALAVKSQLAMPRRVGRGVELSRIQVLAAVLQKFCKLPVGSTDLFLSITGGFRVTEPAIDLAAAMAIASSLKNKPLPPKSICIGEVGLLGEIRSVPFLERRVKEAKRLGYKKIYSRKTHSHVREMVSELF